MNAIRANFDWIANPEIVWTENTETLPGGHAGEDGQPRPLPGHQFQISLPEFERKSSVPFALPSGIDEWSRTQPFHYSALPSPNGVIIYRNGKS